MDQTGRTLVISDGGLCALVACVAAREAVYAGASAEASSTPPASATPDAIRARRPLVFLGDLPVGTGTARRKAVERQCAALDLELVEPTPADTPPSGAPAGERATRVLLSAAYAALRHDASRVTWPVQFFDGHDVDLDGVADAIDRAILVSRLVDLDLAPGLRVEVPYADFTDRHVAELALDLDAPIRTCWWWHAQLAERAVDGALQADEFRAEHKRWTTVLREAGWVAEVDAA